MSWRNVSLVDLALPTDGSFVDGPFGSNLKASEYEVEGVPIIRLQNVRPNEFLSKDIKFISKRKAGELSRHSYLPGDLVISKLGDPPGYACVVPNSAGSGVIVADVVRFRGDPALVDHRYLAFYLNSPGGRQQFLKLAKGATRTRVNLTNIKTIEIPLPPTLDEQKRIAAVLDKADALRRQRQEALQLTEQLIHGIFIDMFGDPATNPKGWPVVPLSELASKFSDGPFGSNLKSSHYTSSGVRVLRLQNIGVGVLKDEDISFISREHYNSLPRHHCKPGDVIVATMGDPNLRAAIVPESLKESLNKADCVQIRPIDKVSNAEYLCWLINMPATLAMAHDLILGETRARVSMGRLKTLNVPKPPFGLQQTFRNTVAKMIAMKDDELHQVVELESLFSSIQQRAFRGELDLSQLKLDEEEAAPVVTPTTEPVASQGRYKRPGCFIAPPEIEAQMLLLEEKLNDGSGDSIAWNENYFKYRILSQVLQAPFSFSQIWEAVVRDIEEPSDQAELEFDIEDSLYKTVRDTIFRYVEEGTLKQQFDENRNEIVFSPRP